jgi:hypothetical protein
VTSLLNAPYNTNPKNQSETATLALQQQEETKQETTNS